MWALSKFFGMSGFFLTLKGPLGYYTVNGIVENLMWTLWWKMIMRHTQQSFTRHIETMLAYRWASVSCHRRSPLQRSTYVSIAYKERNAILLKPNMYRTLNLVSIPYVPNDIYLAIGCKIQCSGGNMRLRTVTLFQAASGQTPNVTGNRGER